jgi:streptomycin 6-kinase
MEAGICCKFRCREIWEAELERLARRWRGYWPEIDPERLAADIRGRLEAAKLEWGLRGLEPLGGGAVALVCAAVQGDRPVVLKLNPRGNPDAEQLGNEGAALRFWQATGAAVELLGHRDEGFTLLMERLGEPLEDLALSREDKLAELGRLAARLHSAGPPPTCFQRLRDFVPGWCRDVPELDPLLIPREADVLIHCDLHAGNALRAGEGWKVIDPKGVRGDRHADIWALIDPMSLEHLPETPQAAADTAARWVDLYAEAAGMDAAEVRRWVRLRARATVGEVGASTSPEEDAWIVGLHRMADALAARDP